MTVFGVVRCESLSRYTALTELELHFDGAWPRDLDALSKTLAPLTRLEMLYLDWNSHDGPEYDDTISGAVRIPSVRTLTVGRCSMSLGGPDMDIACPHLEDFTCEPTGGVISMRLLGRVPDIRALTIDGVCDPHGIDAHLASCVGRTDRYPLHNLQRFCANLMRVSQATLALIGALLPRLTDLDLQLGDGVDVLPFMRATSHRLVRLRTTDTTCGKPCDGGSVVMHALTRLEIYGISDPQVAVLHFPALETLVTRIGARVGDLVAKCPRLLHCALVRPPSPCGEFASCRLATASFPHLLQLSVAADGLQLDEIERLLGMFPGVRWLDIRRQCRPYCTMASTEEETCVRWRTPSKELFRGMSAPCAAAIAGSAVRLAPQLRELYVGSFATSLRKDIYVRRRDMPLAGSHYCDDSAGSMPVHVDEVPYF